VESGGCTKISAGCDHCYAERIALNFRRTFPNGFGLTLHPDRLEQPLHWKKTIHEQALVPWLQGADFQHPPTTSSTRPTESKRAL
jgi:hypothetical protein